MIEFLLCLVVLFSILSFFYIGYFHCGWRFFDREIVRISHKRNKERNDEMKETEDGLYVYSKKDGTWMCLDKHQKIISDFNDALENADYKNKVMKGTK